MALDINSSRGIRSVPVELHSTVTSLAEGVALVSSMEGGKSKAKPSAGGTAERFVGFSQNGIQNTQYATFVEELTIPATSPYTLTLTKLPVADANVGVQNLTAGAAIIVDANASLADGEWSRAGKVVTFHAAQAGAKIRVTYRYALTVVEAQNLFGQGIGDAGQSVTGTTGAITSADYLYTDQFDELSDWWNASASKVYLGANGKITLTAGSNTEIPRAYVYEAPSPSRPFVGITIPD